MKPPPDATVSMNLGSLQNALRNIATLLPYDPPQAVENLNMLADRAEEMWREQQAPCEAVLHHGPGHQSRARCRLKGPHDVHETVYDGSTVAEWRGESATTGFFDEPPPA
jgi:hypothetical protein